MKIKYWQNAFVWISLFFIASCVQPYDPPVIGGGSGLLVINGHLDVENGTSTIKLTRTQNISADTSIPHVELHANVTLEDENGSSFGFNESGNGYYLISGLQINFGSKYRLKIRTSANKEYVSDFVTAKQTPEIDDITTSQEGGGLRVSVNTHDPANNTIYYRWEYTETWEYNSGARSQYVLSSYTWRGIVRDTIVPRTDNVFICWISGDSKNVLVGSTEKLSQDIISNFQLTLAENAKTRIKYSILVKQYGISKEEYNYWQELKKNTENTGGIFSPQPTQVTGNMHGVTDSKEVVIGYFSVYDIKQKRIFRGSEIPPVFYYNLTCGLDTFSIPQIQNPYLFNSNNYYLIDMVTNGMGIASGYTVASPHCADCRYQGGKTTPPDFWQ